MVADGCGLQQKRKADRSTHVMRRERSRVPHFEHSPFFAHTRYGPELFVDGRCTYYQCRAEIVKIHSRVRAVPLNEVAKLDRAASLIKSKYTSGDLVPYLESLTVSQGRLSGQRFKALPWQVRFVRGAFHEGVQSAALSVARGNGKTSLLSAIACAYLDGPLAVQRGEVVIVASSFQQARLSFEHVLAFLGDKLNDRDRWRTWDTAQTALIEDRKTGSRVRCIGSDPRRAHGLAPVLILADEPAQWPHSTSDNMRAALVTAAGKLPESKFVALGTRPADSEHWFAKMLAGGCDYAQTHAAGFDDPKFQRRDLGEGKPFFETLPRSRDRDPGRSQASQKRPGVAGRVRRVEVKSRYR